MSLPIADRRILMALDRLDGRRHTFGLLLRDLIGELRPRLKHLRLLRRTKRIVEVETGADQILLPTALENHYLYSVCLGFYLERLGVELIHFPALFVPYFWGSPAVRKVVTVHGTARASLGTDLVHPMGRLKLARTAQGLSECDAIITVSHRSRGDIIKAFGVSPERIHVVYHGVGPQFSPQAADPRVLRRYGIERPYVLIVSSIKPKKNIVTALRAFARARARGIRHHMVLAGYRADGYRAVDEAITQLGLGSVVHQTGFIEDHEVPPLYAGAEAALVPSLHEGFGLPVIEAFASGCPVLSSDAYALPEIAGGAALLCDPLKTEEMSHCLERVLTDRPFADDLRERGLRRARLFTWAGAAEATIRVYETALADGRT